MRKVKIVKQDYIWECGEKCCSEQGYEWTVDGEYIHRSPCEDNGWLAVLNHLGIEAALEGRGIDGEEIYSL